MKNIIKCLSICVMSFFVGCTPSENRYELENSFSPDDIELAYYQQSEGSNAITLKMLTEGVMGEWDYGIGKSKSNEVSFVVPTSGAFTFTYTVYNQYIGESLGDIKRDITKSIDVNVTKIDVSPGEAYDFLVGKELQSKTWVFAGTPADGGKWFYKSNPKDYSQVWWNMGGTTAGKPLDHAGEMTFDLSEGVNKLIYKSASSAQEVEGAWAFNSNFTQLTTSGDATILGAYAQNEAQPITSFNIAKLTEDELILHCTMLPSSPSDGWTWVFKAKTE